MFLIGIFGWKPRMSEAGAGATQILPCPACGVVRAFQRKTYRMWIEFFFIPVIPTGSPREVLVCSSCKWVRGARESMPAEPANVAPVEDERQIHCLHCGAAIPRPVHTGWRTIHCSFCDRAFEARV